MIVELAENPTTGFQWEITMLDVGVKVLRDEYIADPNPEGFAGGGGKHIYEFAGQGVVKLKKRRPWHKSAWIESREIKVEE